MASNRSQRRLANMQLLMAGLAQAGQGASRFKQLEGQEAQQKILEDQNRRAQELHPFNIDVTKARAEDLRETGSSSAPGMGTQKMLEILAELKTLQQSNPGLADPGAMSSFFTSQDEELARRLQEAGYQPDNALQLLSPDMEEMLEKRKRYSELAPFVNLPQVQEQLFQGGNPPDLPGGTSTNIRDDSGREDPRGQAPFFEGLMGGDRGGGGMEPQAQAHPLQDRLPGQMPTEDIGGFLANMPQGPDATPKDRSFLGEFGQLWQAVMNPATPDEQLIAAWSRLAEFRVQPPMWVGLRLQGQGGPGPV